MRSRSKIAILGAGFASILAAGSIAQSHVSPGVKGNAMVMINHRTETKKRIRHQLPFTGLSSLLPGVFGMTPKEYGIRFGSGCGKKKTNFLRLARNARLRRRKV